MKTMSDTENAADINQIVFLRCHTKHVWRKNIWEHHENLGSHSLLHRVTVVQL